MFFHCFGQKDSTIKDGNSVIKTILILYNPENITRFPYKNYLISQLIYRTIGNQYIDYIAVFDSSQYEYMRDSLPLLVNDSCDFDTGDIEYRSNLDSEIAIDTPHVCSIYKIMTPADMDILLHEEYQYDYNAYEILRRSLIDHPITKPCNYWDIDDDDGDDYLDIGVNMYSKKCMYFPVSIYAGQSLSG